MALDKTSRHSRLAPSPPPPSPAATEPPPSCHRAPRAPRARTPDCLWHHYLHYLLYCILLLTTPRAPCSQHTHTHTPLPSPSVCCLWFVSRPSRVRLCSPLIPPSLPSPSLAVHLPLLVSLSPPPCPCSRVLVLVLVVVLWCVTEHHQNRPRLQSRRQLGANIPV